MRLAGNGMLALLLAMAACTASCSSTTAQTPGTNLSSMQVSSAAAGPCQIDAVKMCQAEGGSAAASVPTQPSTMTSTYGPPNLPESIDFEIPAGQTVKLMCYYDPQHGSVYRADATPDSALTGNSVEYMKKQGFCTNK